MLKKLLDLFRKRKYVSPLTRKKYNSDERRKVDEEIEIIKDEILSIRRKRLEIQVLREVINDSDSLYTESEMNYLYNSIIKKSGVTDN